jgi:hypothetical protein
VKLIDCQSFIRIYFTRSTRAMRDRTNDHEPTNLLSRLPFADGLGKMGAVKTE